LPDVGQLAIEDAETGELVELNTADASVRSRFAELAQAAMDLGLTLRQIGYRVKQFGLEKLIKEQGWDKRR
jgi:transcriptional regulator with GAF, ATPase, and Fis domain